MRMSTEYNTDTDEVVLFLDKEGARLLSSHLARYLRDNVHDHDHFIAAEDPADPSIMDRTRRTPPGNFTQAGCLTVVYPADGESRFAVTEAASNLSRKLPTFHDDDIVSYEVDCQARKVVIRTRRPRWADDGRVCTTVFRDVMGYHFKDDAFGNIIMSFEIVPTETFIASYGEELTNSFVNGGGLGSWAQSSETALKAISEAGATCVVINSVMGLSGWIVAKTYESDDQMAGSTAD